MLSDEHGDYIKVYETPKKWNAALFYMVEHMTDAKLGQIVNFGPTEMKSAKSNQTQVDALLAENTIIHIKDDLYMVNPFKIGNGEWIDVSHLQDICVEDGYIEAPPDEGEF